MVKELVEPMVTLRNNGESTIEIGGKNFKPKTTVAFPRQHAEKLLRLYPEKIADLKSVVKDFNADLEDAVVKSDPDTEVASTNGGDEVGTADANADLLEMTKADLQTEYDLLTEAGVSIPVARNSKPATLVQALINARAEHKSMTETAAIGAADETKE